VRGPARSPAVDAFLYGSSALFAVQVLGASPLLRNRTWAALAWPAYAAGAAAAVLLALLAEGLRPRRMACVRAALAAAVLLGAVGLPLAVEVARRADPARPAASLHPYASSEVVVTEDAAAELMHGTNPYAARLRPASSAERSCAAYGFVPCINSAAASSVTTTSEDA